MVKKEHNMGDQTLSSSKPSMLSASKKKYKGVRMRSWGSWVSEIRAPNQKTRIWLGSYSTAEAAAKAYDAALLCIKGPSACSNLNFPISLESYHQIISDHHDRTTPTSPKSIQRVAAAAANSALVCTVSSPSPSPSSSSAMYSSSPPSSDQQADDDVSLLQGGFTNGDRCGSIEPSTIMMDFWGGLENLPSPRFIDQMLMMGEPFGASLADDVYEEGDIRLWSFC